MQTFCWGNKLIFSVYRERFSNLRLAPLGLMTQDRTDARVPRKKNKESFKRGQKINKAHVPEAQFSAAFSEGRWRWRQEVSGETRRSVRQAGTTKEGTNLASLLCWLLWRPCPGRDGAARVDRFWSSPNNLFNYATSTHYMQCDRPQNNAIPRTQLLICYLPTNLNSLTCMFVHLSFQSPYCKPLCTQTVALPQQLYIQRQGFCWRAGVHFATLWFSCFSLRYKKFMLSGLSQDLSFEISWQNAIIFFCGSPVELRKKVWEYQCHCLSTQRLDQNRRTVFNIFRAK